MKKNLQNTELEENQLIHEISQDNEASEFVRQNKIGLEQIISNIPLFLSFLDKKEGCQQCKGLEHCPQSIKGNQAKLDYFDNIIDLTYTPCPLYEAHLKKIEQSKNLSFLYAPNQFKGRLYINDNRKIVLTEVKNFLANYPKDGLKGLYLHGSFGSGKSFIVSYLAQELADRDHQVLFAYYPELVRKIKSLIGKDEFETLVETLKKVEILILDDFGGENASGFIRDEVLGAILQDRMVNHRVLFMTSNLDEERLVDHLSDNGKEIDLIKARRIFERMHVLMNFVKLDDKNYR